MPLTNSPSRFGLIARVLHWLGAVMILTGIVLGLYGEWMPYDTGETLAAKAQVFSLHKTLGVAAFFLALVRILWTLTQARPVPLHPERRIENWMADLVHWMLYVSLLAVPLSGWVHHAATTGFAPILWPFGQGLPLVAKSELVEIVAKHLHWFFGYFLIAAILLHLLGALKHLLIDRDATLARMVTGRAAPDAPLQVRRSLWPMVAAIATLAALATFTVNVTLTLYDPYNLPPEDPEPAVVTTPGNWTVENGTLAFSIRQMGSTLKGSLAKWSAAIAFDQASGTGHVAVTIDMTSLSLGSVTAQAKTPDFLDTAGHPTATFTAAIRPVGEAFVAEGMLSLRGVDKSIALPFTLQIDNDRATMAAQIAIDRRDFGIGAKYPDEKTVGFVADVAIALTATRQH